MTKEKKAIKKKSCKSVYRPFIKCKIYDMRWLGNNCWSIDYTFNFKIFVYPLFVIILTPILLLKSIVTDNSFQELWMDYFSYKGKNEKRNIIIEEKDLNN